MKCENFLVAVVAPTMQLIVRGKLAMHSCNRKAIYYKIKSNIALVKY